MNEFTAMLLELLQAESLELGAWVVLPNHYHFIAETDDIKAMLKSLGQLHGRTSFTWNGEEQHRGRKVWCNALDRPLLTDDYHHHALNYVHHNPVKHGHVEKWTDWKWSSASDFLARMGREEAARLWREFMPKDFGNGWDD